MFFIQKTPKMYSNWIIYIPAHSAKKTYDIAAGSLQVVEVSLVGIPVLPEKYRKNILAAPWLEKYPLNIK